MNDIIGTIYIAYSGCGFKGEIIIHSMEYFPIPVTHMKRLIKICQMSSCCEEIYLHQFMEDLKYLQEHSGFFSHRKAKMLQDNIKIVQERLDKLGGRR